MFTWTLLANIVAFLATIWCCDGRVSAVAVFRRDEVDFHKYSAVLAAIEPFRLQLKEEVKQSMNPISYFFHKWKGTKIEDPDSSVRMVNRGVDAAYSRYESRINDIVRSYGMTVDAFNGISFRVMKEPVLKKKVLLQAYYYRIAADLETNTKADLPLLPAISNAPLRVAPDEGSYSIESFQESDFERFCKALRTIENERLLMRETLQRELGIRDLPVRMCDPDVKPVMCRQVQAACETFPAVVRRVVEFYGLTKKEFDDMFEKSNTDAFFGSRVRKEINRIDRERKRKKIDRDLD